MAALFHPVLRPTRSRGNALDPGPPRHAGPQPGCTHVAALAALGL